MTESLIEARGLSTGYGKMAVVRDLDLRVGAGEVVALIGPNGAGKTTTLLTLAGELTPMEGEVRFLGQADQVPDARAVPERPRLRQRGAIGDHGDVGPRQPEAGPGLAGGGVRALPGPRADHEPPGRALLGRRAADALVGQGPRAAAQAACWPTSCPSVLPRSSSTTSSRPSAPPPTSAASASCSWSSTSVRHCEIADRVYVMERGRVVLSGTSDDVAGQLDKVEAAYLTGGG